MPQASRHVCTYQLFQSYRYELSYPALSHGPKEMCLSLEHQNPLKTSEKMGYFDRVTVSSLHILYTANQETEGSQDWHLVPRSPFWRRAVRQRGYDLRLLIFKTANNKVDLGQIRSEEIVYSRFIKILLG